VIDPKVLSASSSPIRASYLKASLEELNEELDDNLTLLLGDTASELASFASQNGISDLYSSRDVTPLSRVIERQVAEALSQIGVRVHFVDTPYLVDLDKVLKEDGSPFRVFTPYFKAWIKGALAEEVARLPRHYEFRSSKPVGPIDWGPLEQVVSYRGQFATSSAVINAVT
jgi:deoxyribodipyrimidine photo-lyase